MLDTIYGEIYTQTTLYKLRHSRARASFMDTTYTVSEVAQKLNLSDKTLRRWEEAGRFSPSRTLGNQRRYTIEDIQVLDAIKHGSIPDQADLLTKEQAAALAGVSEVTIDRWEREGKIHPFITVGRTFYPKHRLQAKMHELKEKYVKAEDMVATPVEQPVEIPEPAREVQPPKPALSKLAPSTSLTQPHTPFNLQFAVLNILITLILLTSYHLFFASTKEQVVSPQAQTGAVQGIQTQADPRVDELLQKFEDHLSSEMLKDAATPPITTINVDGSAVISGVATLVKNQNQISVPVPTMTEQTSVTVTFTSDFAPAKKYWVVPAQGSFTLHTDFPVSADATFHYFSLNTTPTATSSATQ